jgi:hypothetical protein
MRMTALAATALGLTLAACSGWYPQPSAVVQQHAYSNCTGNDGQCSTRQLAARALASNPRTNAAFGVGPRPATSPNGVPAVDVEQICQGTSQQGMRAKEECFNTEQEVRNELVKKWGGFDTADRAHCASESMGGGVSSYTELLTCLQMASGARKLREETDASRNSLAIGQR